MPEFTVRYFFSSSEADERDAYVSRGVTAESLDEATRLVQDEMRQELLTFDSDGHGRVIVNRGVVRFCSLLPAMAPEESALRVQAEATAHAQTDFQTRAAAMIASETRPYGGNV